MLFGTTVSTFEIGPDGKLALSVGVVARICQKIRAGWRKTAWALSGTTLCQAFVTVSLLSCPSVSRGQQAEMARTMDDLLQAAGLPRLAVVRSFSSLESIRRVAGQSLRVSVRFNDDVDSRCLSILRKSINDSAHQISQLTNKNIQITDIDDAHFKIGFYKLGNPARVYAEGSCSLGNKIGLYTDYPHMAPLQYGYLCVDDKEQITGGNVEVVYEYDIKLAPSWCEPRTFVEMAILFGIDFGKIDMTFIGSFNIIQQQRALIGAMLYAIYSLSSVQSGAEMSRIIQELP